MNRKLKVKILSPLTYVETKPATPESAGIDLRACMNEPITIYPQEQAVNINTGIAIEGENTDTEPCVFLTFIRSGISCKHGISLVNSVGVIDSDYRGEIRLGIINTSSTPYEIQPNDRIAQLVCCPINTLKIEIVDELSETARGKGGLGSTGNK